MEKARKETESTRCPRPGLIPAVLKGISSRETFLAVKRFWQSAAGAEGQQVSPFFVFFFLLFTQFGPAGPSSPQRDDNERRGRPRARETNT